MSSDPAAKLPRRSVRIGRYEVLAHIATGGMGAVYKARDTESGQEVALKVLPPEMAAKPSMLERFRREAKAAAKLRHENVVTFLEFGEHHNTYYLAAEFIDGIDLHDYCHDKGPLDPAEALEIIRQGCRALDHAYRCGIIHRDIKPSNFLLTRQGDRLVVKMTDLGLARETSGEEFRVTKAGTTVGTLDYMSPEQARDSGLADIRSDLYSLGATWYHLLSGHAPFPKGGLGERLNRIMNEEPPDVRKFNPRVSGAMLAVLRRLMAKHPDDRYQKPADLLRDLDSLAKGKGLLSSRELLENLAQEEGEPTVIPRRRPTRSHPGRRTPPPTRSRSLSDTDTGKSTAGRAIKPDTAQNQAGKSELPYFRYGLAGAAAIVLVGAMIIALVWRGRHRVPPAVEDTSASAALPKVPSPEPKPIPPAPNPSEAGKQIEEPKPPVVKLTKPRWPALYRPQTAVDFAALGNEIRAASVSEPAAGSLVELIVGRLPPDASGKTFSSLAAACKAIPAGATGVIELRDNGPFYDASAAVSDRNLVIRAAKGYRPLLVWDAQRTIDERRRAGQTSEPLVFLQVRRGHLTLQGIHLALRWPEAPSQGAAVLHVADGNLTVSGCTFSVAGKPRDGLTLARFTATDPDSPAPASGSRLTFQRCHVRCEGLSLVDLNAPGAEALFADCLLVGGDAPLLQVAAGERPTALRAVRSTMICGKDLLHVRSAKETLRDPAFHWLGWDVLLSHKTKPAGGELLCLRGGIGTRNMKWRAVNCLYSGWEKLLSGTASIAATDTAGWRKLWGRSEGDETRSDPWPAAVFPEPAELPASTYRTAGSAVAFAASTATDRLLGCDVDALPPVRDNWLPLTFDRVALQIPAPLEDADPPDVPVLDLSKIDLGAYLQDLQRWNRLGPQTVLRLTGSGERFTSPIRIKGSNVVLFFEPPQEKEEPLTLVPAGRSPAEAFIDIEQGNLDIIGGRLRMTEASEARLPSWFIRMRGGDVRLLRTHLEVSPKCSGPSFRGLISFDGSGDAAPEHVRSCLLNESALLSAREAIRIHGIGARVLLAQSLLVAGEDALGLSFERGFAGRANVQCLLDRATVAARGSVIHIPDVRTANPPAEPVVMQMHDCAFLNPFVGRNSRPALVSYDGEALASGLLVWQSDRDAFDARLWFASAAANWPRADKPEQHSSWPGRWGTPALHRPVLELLVHRTLTGERWALERFLGLKIPGANLEKLNLARKPAKKPMR